MISEDAYDYLFKIVIIGDSGVGKSNLLLRYTVSSWQKRKNPLSPVFFFSKIFFSQMNLWKTLEAQ